MRPDPRHSSAARHRILVGARHRGAVRRASEPGAGRRRMLAGVAAASVVALLIGASSASAYWTASGSSTATAASGTTSALTITATVGAASLHPGGLAPLRASVTNPNATAVRVRALELDPTQGDGSGFAVDGGHSGCGTAAFTFRDQVID